MKILRFLGIRSVIGIAFSHAVLAFTTPRNNVRICSTCINAATDQLQTAKDALFDTYFAEYVSKEDVRSFFSTCCDVQNSKGYKQPAEWADACKIVEAQQENESSKIVATRDINEGDILTLCPFHALGIRNAVEREEYIEFISEADKELYGDKINATMKVQVTVSRKNITNAPLDPACTVIGNKNFIRLFTILLPGKEVIPGWLGGIIQTTTVTVDANCITLPLPTVSPFCAVVATKHIKKGEEILKDSQPPWNLEEELVHIVKRKQRLNIASLRNRLRKSFVGLFHQVNLDYPGIRQIHKDPDIYEVDNFLTDEECDRIITKATPYAEKSMQYIEEEQKYVEHVSRTYKHAVIPKREIPSINAKITSMACCSISEVGSNIFLHYEEGKQQKVDVHVDAGKMSESELFNIDYGEPDKYQMWGVLFCYLNDVDATTGGSTYFPEIDLRITPKKGSALIHFSADLQGRADGRTFHTGTPSMHEKMLIATTLWNTTDIGFDYVDSKVDPMSTDII